MAVTYQSDDFGRRQSHVDDVWLVGHVLGHGRLGVRQSDGNGDLYQRLDRPCTARVLRRGPPAAPPPMHRSGMTPSPPHTRRPELLGIIRHDILGRVGASPPPPRRHRRHRRRRRQRRAHGYWLVGSDGGIFSFGSAQFYGSTGSLKLQRPVVGIVPTKDDAGYWLDASDGGIFAFGDTQFYGSIPGLGLHPAGSGLPNSLDAPIVGMVPSNDDGGYFMVASDGGVFAFGDAHFAGSCPGIGGCSGAAVAVMPDASGNGYWLVTKTGNVYTFGDAPNYGAPGTPGPR